MYGFAVESTSTRRDRVYVVREGDSFYHTDTQSLIGNCPSLSKLIKFPKESGGKPPEYNVFLVVWPEDPFRDPPYLSPTVGDSRTSQKGIALTVSEGMLGGF